MKNHSVIIAVFAAAAAHAAPYNWAGSSSSDWTDVGNWRDTNNAVPAVPPGTGANDDVTFGAPGAFQPAVASQYPPTLDNNARIGRLVFNGSGIDISGNGPLLLNRGGNTQLDFNQRYINANAGTTNTISVPLLLCSGSNGDAYFAANAGAMLVFGSTISYTNATVSARNLFLRGPGTFDLRGSAHVADLRAEEGAVLLLNNPVGRSYAPAGGKKVRLLGGSAIWLHDNQIDADSVTNVILRIDNGGFADLNCKTDTVHEVYFSLDHDAGGTLSTGDSGLLRIRNTTGAISVGSTARTPSSTSVINGNILIEGAGSSTAKISTRRGTADAELVVNAIIDGACAVSVDNVANSGAPGGIVVFNAINTYAQTTKILNGTLVVNGATGPGKVEIAAAGRLEGTGVVDPANAFPALTIAVAGGTIAPGAPLGTLTIGSPDGGENNVVFTAPGSVLEIRADASGAASLKVNGAIQNAHNAVLRISATERPPAGRYLVAEASEGINGVFAAIEDETDLLRLRHTAGSNQITLFSHDPGTLMIVK